MDYEAAVRTAKELAQAGNLEQAVSLCRSVIDAHPGLPAEPGARLVMGYILIKKNAPASESIEHFTTAATDFPTSPEAPQALLRIGYLREKNGQPAPEWGRLVADYPGSTEAAEALHCLGHFALRAGDPELAIKRFEESATASGASAEVSLDSQIECAYACISAYWRTESRASLRRAITEFTALLDRPADANSTVLIRLGLAEALLKYGLAAQAVEQYRAVLALDPQDAFLRGLASFGLGCALLANREWQSSEQALSAFLDARAGQTLKQKDADWRAVRPGYTQLLVADPAKAAGLPALELVPGAVYQKALSLFEQGRYREARDMADDLLVQFADLTVAPHVRGLSKMCGYVLAEVR